MTFATTWLKNPRKGIVAIGVASCFASLVYSFAYRIPPVVDAHAYDVMAMNIVQGKGFQEDATKQVQFDPGIVRAGPGYEYLLAAVYAAFGHRYEIVWILQAILHGASAVLLFIICTRLFSERGERIGLIAAALIGFSPDLIESSAMLLTETSYLFLLIVTVWLFVEAFRRPRSVGWAAALGGSLGLAVLFRPPVAVFIAAILFFYAMRKATVQAVVCSLVFCAVLTPWTIRNYQVYHEFIPTTLIGSYNLWLNNLPSSNGGQYSSETSNPLIEFGSVHGYAAVKQKASQEFWNFITRHPVDFIRLCAIRTVRYFTLIRPMGFWFYQQGIGQIVFVAASGIWIAVLFVAGFSGMLDALKRKDPLLCYLVFFALLAPAVLIPTVVQSRYRFQIYPFLAIFGAYVLSRIRTDWAELKRPLAIVSAVLLCVTLADGVISSQTVIEHLRALVS